MLHRDGLAQELEDSGLKRCRGFRRRRVSRHHDRGQRPEFAGDGLEQFESSAIRQVHVEDAEVRLHATQDPHRVVAIVRRVDRPPAVAEEFHEDVAERIVVFHEQDGVGTGHGLLGAPGRKSSNK